VKASRFTLAELDCLWGEYKAEDVETGTVVPSRVIHEAFGRKWMARLRREALGVAREPRAYGVSDPSRSRFSTSRMLSGSSRCATVARRPRSVIARNTTAV